MADHTSVSNSKDRTWACADCKTVFKKSKLLEAHASATQHQSYQCKFCEKTSNKRTAWVRHEGSHSAEKRHPCSLCGKAFRRRDHCQDHENTCGNTSKLEKFLPSVSEAGVLSASVGETMLDRPTKRMRATCRSSKLTEDDTETTSLHSQHFKHDLASEGISVGVHSRVSGAGETNHPDAAQLGVSDPEGPPSRDETTAEAHQANGQHSSEAEYKCIFPGCTQRFVCRIEFDKHEQGHHFPPFFSPWSKALRDHQKINLSVITVLKQQQDGFFQQALAFQDTHGRQEDSINAILAFLATFYRRPTEAAPGQFFGRTAGPHWQDTSESGSRASS